eukprot:6268988-Ditylum_brightwellii.AAC.1
MQAPSAQRPSEIARALFPMKALKGVTIKQLIDHTYKVYIRYQTLPNAQQQLIGIFKEYADAVPHTQHISGSITEKYGTITDAFAALPTLLGYVEQEYGKAILEYNKTGNPNNLKQKYDTKQEETTGPDIPLTDHTLHHDDLKTVTDSLLFGSDVSTEDVMFYVALFQITPNSYSLSTTTPHKHILNQI